MDLGKIIAQLRTELQCLDTVIASIEELARVQSLAEAGVGEAVPSGVEPEKDLPPEKPRRGRLRKSDAGGAGEPPAPANTRSDPSEDNGGGSPPGE